MMTLDAFLADLAKKPFCWRNLNCGLELADWWQANHGFDPAVELRGAVTCASEADQLIVESGGLVALVEAIATRAGAVRSAGDRPGDFGVIEASGIQYCAIRSAAGRWIVKAEHGIAGFRDCAVLAAWSI